MNEIPPFAAPLSSDINELRARLRAMSNAQLRRFARTARLMCSRVAQFGPGDRTPVAFEIQLEEAVIEWQRRNLGKLKTNPTKTSRNEDQPSRSRENPDPDATRR